MTDNSYIKIIILNKIIYLQDNVIKYKDMLLNIEDGNPASKDYISIIFNLNLQIQALQDTIKILEL